MGVRLFRRSPKTPSEVIRSSFLGIARIECCKNAPAHRDHPDMTQSLPVAILSRGVLTKPSPDGGVSSTKSHP